MADLSKLDEAFEDFDRDMAEIAIRWRQTKFAFIRGLAVGLLISIFAITALLGAS